MPTIFGIKKVLGARIFELIPMYIAFAEESLE